MATNWTLTYQPGQPNPAARTRTLAGWGISSLTRSLNNLQADVVDIAIDGALVDDPAPWAYGQVCAIYRDGVQWFYGVVVTNPRQASGPAEGMEYRLEGPWWYAQRKIFEQNWKYRDPENPEAEPTERLVTRAVLCQRLNGPRMTTGEQIGEVVDLLIARGCPIQKGTIEPAVYAPYNEVRDMPCAEVIRNMMRWTPNAVVWFDYATTPPTLHVTSRDNMPAVTQTLGGTLLPGSGGVRVGPIDLQITPRHDLIVPAVVIHIERVNSIDGYSYTSVDVQKAPPEATGTEFGAMICTLELGGGTKSIQRQRVVAPFIDISSEDWWRAHKPELNSVVGLVMGHPQKANLTGIKKVGGGPGLPRELKGGAIPSWETQAQTYEVEVFTVFSGLDKSGASEYKHEFSPISIQLMGTELSDKTYSRTSSATEAEQAPPNLAQQLYDVMSVLHYDGSITLWEPECSSAVRPGMKLNIAGGHADWATMGAQVQQVREDVFRGTTEVGFGAPEHLGTQDLLELMRVTNGRRVSTRAAEREGGEPSEAVQTDGPTGTAIQRGANLGGSIIQQALSSPSDNEENKESKITFDLGTKEDPNPKLGVQHKDGAATTTTASSTELKSEQKGPGAGEEIPTITVVTTATGAYQLLWNGKEGLPKKAISLSLDDITDTDKGVDIKLRKAKWCVAGEPSDAPAKYVWVLMSDPIEGEV
ncbi:hypothetical protein DB346_08420 [Verrucomicrobia bacterium LW23]|nr:hypothetical protein DB346_08420 [Verrucomicrobia bacterium LW23]